MGTTPNQACLLIPLRTLYSTEPSQQEGTPSSCNGDHSHLAMTPPSRSSTEAGSPPRRVINMRQRHRRTRAPNSAARGGTGTAVLTFAAGLNLLLCQQGRSVHALVPSHGVARPSSFGGGTQRSAHGLGSSSQSGPGARRGARRRGVDMRSTLTPPERVAADPSGAATAVLDRNDGGTQTVREMSAQMSQVLVCKA